MNNAILDKSFGFSVRIVRLKEYLNAKKHERIIANQVLRSGTSIGADVTEADQAQSKSDFISKMSIANKEAHETRYWLRLLHTTGYLTDAEYASITAIVKSSLESFSPSLKQQRTTINNLILLTRMIGNGSVQYNLQAARISNNGYADVLHPAYIRR